MGTMDRIPTPSMAVRAIGRNTHSHQIHDPVSRQPPNTTLRLRLFETQRTHDNSEPCPYVPLTSVTIRRNNQYRHRLAPTLMAEIERPGKGSLSHEP